MKMKTMLTLALFSLFFSSCVVIRPGEVGVKQRLGKISNEALSEGPRGYNPFTTSIITLPTRTVNLEIKSNLPSKEGLTITSVMSILYRIRPSSAPTLLRDVGRAYESEIILPVFRSAAADVSSRFLAKDMHSGERAVIEAQIRDRMAEILEPKGLIVDNVLMKSIVLPAGLSRSIEEVLQAEQDAQRMEFIKQREQLDAERRIIQAQGERDAAVIQADAERQRVEIQAAGDAAAIRLQAEAQAEANANLQQSLTDEVLRNRAIQAFLDMARSQNTKIIITNGESPFLGLPAEELNVGN
ncbi:prohibitin family protein [Phaeodactylibacter sp.]|jgi:regulator of protease activity HflC (stomatin/prohibitin superfamily)|uniref:prohibitin family protein n=1 Tax=Phaeodactylibacter sp. TaxID=1940289 RepID=UPI0025D503F5|nr:prohibitin family protein [Phaeodactylibacter sp.]MCI4650123.1 prohibitin family protein [Phaeodactylibacter sp.]MCI5091330.1 prohibitin family protein [Phaeodactylibacter sp.]